MASSLLLPLTMTDLGQVYALSRTSSVQLLSRPSSSDGRQRSSGSPGSRPHSYCAQVDAKTKRVKKKHCVGPVGLSCITANCSPLLRLQLIHAVMHAPLAGPSNFGRRNTAILTFKRFARISRIACCLHRYMRMYMCGCSMTN